MFNLFGRQPANSGMDFGDQAGLLGGGFSDPRTLGLLGASAAMLEASGPSKLPVSLGQVMGRGFMGGLGTYQQAQQFDFMNQMKKAQMGKLEGEAQKLQQINAYAQTLPEQDRPLFLADPGAYIKSKVDKSGPMVIPAGGTVVDPKDPTKPLFSAPFKPTENKPSTLSQLISERASLQPGDPNIAFYDEAIRKATTHQPPIANIDLRQDTKFNEKLGAELGEQYSALLKADVAAPANIGKYQRLSQLLGNVNTGKFRGTITDMKAVAKGMGFDLTAMGIADDVAPAQAARALSNQIALELRNPAGGAGMPGALSDKDREFLLQSIPGLENDPAAVGKMIEYRVKLEERAQKVARMAREYRKKNGRFDEGFYDELQEWSNKNPLFPDFKQAPAPSPIVQTGGVVDFGSLK